MNWIKESNKYHTFFLIVRCKVWYQPCSTKSCFPSLPERPAHRGGRGGTVQALLWGSHSFLFCKPAGQEGLNQTKLKHISLDSRLKLKNLCWTLYFQNYLFPRKTYENIIRIASISIESSTENKWNFVIQFIRL